jgi:hypothetical protein
VFYQLKGNKRKKESQFFSFSLFFFNFLPKCFMGERNNFYKPISFCFCFCFCFCFFLLISRNQSDHIESWTGRVYKIFLLLQLKFIFFFFELFFFYFLPLFWVVFILSWGGVESCCLLKLIGYVLLIKTI